MRILGLLLFVLSAGGVYVLLVPSSVWAAEGDVPVERTDGTFQSRPLTIDDISGLDSDLSSVVFTAGASLSGVNTGDQTITLTGDVAGSGTGTFAATIAADAVGVAELNDGSNTPAPRYVLHVDPADTSRLTYYPAPSGGTNGCAGASDKVTFNSSTGWGCGVDGGGGGPTFNSVSYTEVTAGSNVMFVNDGDGTMTMNVSSGTATLGDGDYGDIVVSSAGTVMTVDDGVIGVANLVSADFGDFACNGTACSLDATYLTGNETITLSGDITGSGATTITTALSTNAVADNEIDYTAVTLNDLTFDVGSVSKTEFGYLNGVTSGIQSQLNSKYGALSDFTGTLTDTKICVYDQAGGEIDCNYTDQTGAGGGDEVSVDGVAVTNPDFVSTGDIDFVDTSNTVTANLNSGVVGVAELASADFGDFTCNGAACSLDVAFMQNFTVAGDSGGGQTISNGNTLSILGDGTGIDTADSATGTVTITFDPVEAEAGLEAVLDLQALQGAVTDAQVPDSITVSLAASATALAANGGNCTAGNAPLGVDASGAVEGCFDAWTEAENTAAGYLQAASVDSDLTTFSLPASTTISAFGATVVDDTDAAAARDTLKVRDVIWAAVSDETTDLTTGAAELTLYMPDAFTIDTSIEDGVGCSVNTAPTGSAITVGINETGVSILSTDITIDATENTSKTAATAPVVSDTALASGSAIAFDIDGVGSTTAGQGLKCWIIGAWQ